MPLSKRELEALTNALAARVKEYVATQLAPVIQRLDELEGGAGHLPDQSARSLGDAEAILRRHLSGNPQ